MEKLAVHRRKLHRDTYRCNHCDFEATSLTLLMKHKRRTHNKDRFPCSQCSYIGPYMSNLRKHQRSVHGMNYKCAVCDARAKENGTGYTVAMFTKQEFEGHMATEHEGEDLAEALSSGNKVYTCTVCGKTKPSAQSLRVHMRRLHQDSYSCKQCDFEAATYLEIKKHMSATHNKDRFLCDQCDFTSTHLFRLKKHQQLCQKKREKGDKTPSKPAGLKPVLSEEDKKFKCTHGKCTFGCLTEDQLKKHVDSKHKNWFCDQCAYQTTSHGAFIMHKRAKHEMIRYKCSQCDFETAYDFYLKVHIETIHERIRYPCDVCGHLSASLDLLKRHKKTIHEGVKYTCEQCGYKVGSLPALCVHRKKHEGILYECNQGWKFMSCSHD